MTDKLNLKLGDTVRINQILTVAKTNRFGKIWRIWRRTKKSYSIGSVGFVCGKRWKRCGYSEYNSIYSQGRLIVEKSKMCYLIAYSIRSKPVLCMPDQLDVLSIEPLKGKKSNDFIHAGHTSVYK